MPNGEQLLDYSSERAWIMHSRGAFDVLEALGPYSIVTEIDKSMLIAQAELMVLKRSNLFLRYSSSDSEQILEATFANVGIFLDRPDWQNALRSTIISETSFEDRSEPVVTLWMITACAPGLFQRATDIVMNQNLDQKNALESELRGLLLSYSIWNARWGSSDLTSEGVLPERRNGLFDDPSSVKRAEILVRYLAYLALIYRFLSAIQPPHSASLTEQAAMTAASQVIQLAESFRTDLVPTLRVRIALRIAWSIRNTARQWSESQQLHLSDRCGTISPSLFTAWCALLRRATGEPVSCINLG